MDGVAAFSTGKALADALGGRHVEGRGFVIVERA
jgi:hypothetical protein